MDAKADIQYQETTASQLARFLFATLSLAIKFWFLMGKRQLKLTD